MLLKHSNYICLTYFVPVLEIMVVFSERTNFFYQFGDLDMSNNIPINIGDAIRLQEGRNV